MTIPIDQLTTNALAAKIDGAALRSTNRTVSSDVVGARLRLAAINDTQWVALTADPDSDWTVEA